MERFQERMKLVASDVIWEKAPPLLPHERTCFRAGFCVHTEPNVHYRLIKERLCKWAAQLKEFGPAPGAWTPLLTL